MSLVGRIMDSWNAGRDAWSRYGSVSTDEKLMIEYSDRWAFYQGTIFNEAWRKSPYRSNTRLYKGLTLLLKHAEAVVDFYATTVYQGDLSTDGKPLPNGTYGAIPIDPQVGGSEDGDETQSDIIRTAFAELTSAWNWKQNMTLRPMYGSALGDVLTELIDDPDKGFVYPQVVWPGYVKKIELDYVGNVKEYHVEYQVVEEDETRGRQYYRYGKTVTTEEFRYYKDGKPFDYYGNGAVEKNPYGFVPAIWDRHKIAWGERGTSALQGTWQATLQVNSLLSQSFDFQRKAFFAPIFIKGIQKRRSQLDVQVTRPPKTSDEEDDYDGLAEAIGIMPITGDNPAMLQPQFNLGSTIEVVKMVLENIVDENPEARFYKELRGMSQLTGPGAERALGDAVSRCNRARAGYDVQTIKLFQMAMTMCGIRANDGSWGRLNRRQQVFRPFSLDSYKAGGMDFTILERPVILPTEYERVELVQLKETIRSTWGREQIGMSEDDILSLEMDEALAAVNTGIGAPSPSGALTPEAAVDRGEVEF